MRIFLEYWETFSTHNGLDGNFSCNVYYYIQALLKRLSTPDSVRAMNMLFISLGRVKTCYSFHQATLMSGHGRQPLWWVGPSHRDVFSPVCAHHTCGFWMPVFVFVCGNFFFVRAPVPQSPLTLSTEGLMPIWWVQLTSGQEHIQAGKKAGLGCQLLLQGILPTQGSHPGLQYCR